MPSLAHCSQVMYMYYFLGYRMFLDTDARITGPRDSYDSIIEQLPPEIKLKVTSVGAIFIKEKFKVKLDKSFLNTCKHEFCGEV